MGEPYSKKRKRSVVVHQAPLGDALDTSRPTAVFQSTGKGRPYTLSLAVPGSIIANAQSHDLRTALAGRIARAAAVFCVDEIIIFNDGQVDSHSARNGHYQHRTKDYQSEDGYTGTSDPDHFLYHLLSYLECPPHLRMKLFPLHPNLRTAGSCPSLDMPHHLKSDEWCQYREGVTVGPADSSSESSLVDVGFSSPVTINASIPPDTRVTLKFEEPEAPLPTPFRPASIPKAEAVDPAEPREEGGYYWGYTIRQALSLSAVFTESPFEDGYDVSIGTSERGVALSHILFKQSSSKAKKGADISLPEAFKHALIVFGGVAGLEAAAAADHDLVEKGITKANVGELFDFWVNACPGQGSRTIRTEEAVWVTLSQLHGWVQSAN